MTTKKNETSIENDNVENEDVIEDIQDCIDDIDSKKASKKEKKAKKPKEKTPLEKLQDERNAYLEMAQRTKAEFDNFKKRNATLRTDSIDDGVREAITTMLPVIDNLERAIDLFLDINSVFV